MTTYVLVACKRRAAIPLLVGEDLEALKLQAETYECDEIVAVAEKLFGVHIMGPFRLMLASTVSGILWESAFVRLVT